MQLRLFSVLTAVGLTALVASSPAIAEVPQTLSIATGHSVTLDVRHLTRVAVGDAQIAGVVPLGDSHVIVNAKHAGRTSVFVWSGNEQRSYDVTVTDQGVDDLATMLRTTLDEPAVTVAGFDHSLVVRGTVADLPSFSRLREVLDRFAPLAKTENYTIVNAVTVSAPFAAIDRSLATMPKARDLHVDTDNKGDLIVSGEADDQVTAEAVLARVRGLAGAFLAADGKVIDRLSVTSVSQIGVKVYILEIDRTGLSQLGIRLQGANPDPNLPNVLDYGDPSFLFPEAGAAAAVGKALNVGPFVRQTRLAPTLDLILQSGDARILAAPNLVTTPGQEAKFLVGGEVPYAYSTGLGEVSVVFKEYGVKLDMTPSILPDGAVETKLTPEVSQLDFQDGIQENGFTVPALKTSRISTDVITHPGESIVLGGLLNRLQQRNIYKIPLLGDLPILGKLFRSTRYQNQDTDVVFVMTPEILTR